MRDLRFAMRGRCLFWSLFTVVGGLWETPDVSRHVVAQQGLRADELLAVAADPSKHPLSDEERSQLKRQWDDGIAELSRKLETQPDDLSALLKRGDLFFFRGDFAKAVRDYQRMCEVNTQSEGTHWQLGIAYFYADQPEKSAKLFEQFFQTDKVDREGGLWKFVADAKSLGAEKARGRLLKYSKDDREPLSAVYRMFEGQSTPEELL